MKLSSVTVLLSCLSVASGFSTPFIAKTQSVSSSALNLFGGKKEGGDKGPGMMDQLGMLKKAQEVASKKMAMDKELAKVEHVGESANGNVKVTVKYVPPPPMQQPGYEATKVDIDDGYFNDESTTSGDLSTSVQEALKDGYAKATIATAENMQALTKELAEVMGDIQGGMGM